MAILRVKLRGQKINDLLLEDQKEYFAGRKESSDIVLQPEKGISRDHFVLKRVNDEWSVEVLSKYSSLIVGGESKNQLTLKDGLQFSVPPYDFEFRSGDDLISTSRVPIEMADNSIVQNEEEKTFVGVVQSLAYLKVMDANLMIPKELLRLEYGESWVAGRDEQCQILISDQRVSRKQFEIRKKGLQYFIVDLGSVNGTLVNGSAIQSNTQVPLKSGDAITVLDNLIFFELHDPNFKKKIESLQQLQPYNPLESLPDDPSQGSQVAIYQPSQNSVAEYYPQQEHPSGTAPGVMIQPSLLNVQTDQNKKKKMFYILIAAIVLIAGYFYSEQMNEENEKKVVTPVNQIADPISKLTPEQQAFVRQTYELSVNYIKQGKYQLAQQEIIKLKDLVPSYKDSQEIERMASESLMILDEQRKAEQQERLKQENEDKIQRQTNVCREKITEEMTMDQLDQCLTNVIEFGPLHPKIVELKNIVERNIAAKQLEAAQKAATQAEVQKLVVIYKKAQSVEALKNPFKTMDAYDLVIKSKLPDPGGLKGISKSKIEKIRQTLSSDTKRFQQEAEKLYQAQDLKGAILVLRKAQMVDPTNMELRDKADQWINELRKQMMAIYQEGILEESFGNVEGSENKQGAKDRWKKILNLDIPDGEYYLKAQIKIKKYGAQ